MNLRILSYFIFHWLLISTVFGQSGYLDPSFADEGIMTWNVSGKQDNGHGIGVQSDGKIVVASSGEFFDIFGFNIGVVRLTEDGNIDSTFADNGKFLFGDESSSGFIYHLEVLSDDKILVAGGYSVDGSLNQELIIIKLLADGTPDTSFGDDGVVLQQIDDGEDYIHSFVIDYKDRIVAGGTCNIAGSVYSKNFVARFEPNGIADTSFADNGVFIWNENDNYNDVWDVAVSEDRAIFASGRGKPFGTDRLSVYKILEDGSSLDSTFADNGELFAPFQGTAYGMIIHSNGNILISGPNYNVNGADLVVLAYHQDGTANTDFGQDGVFMIDVNANDIGLNLIEQPDGKIIAFGESGGQLFSPPPRAFFSVRMDENGNIDDTWGDQGYVVTETGWMAWASDAAIQDDGKILLAGLSAEDNNDLQVVRYGNFIDADMDGFGMGEDCNDLIFEINPGAEEIANNGIDEDCDGMDLLVGNQNIEKDIDIIIYPNPVEGELQVKLSEINQEVITIEIIDGAGKLVLPASRPVFYQDPAIRINMADLPSGLYLIRIHTSSGIINKRVVKS